MISTSSVTVNYLLSKHCTHCTVIAPLYFSSVPSAEKRQAKRANKRKRETHNVYAVYVIKLC